MSEGKVYSCFWKKTKKGYEGKIDNTKASYVFALDIDDLKEKLHEQALELYGDGESILTFTPKLKEYSRYGDLKYYGLGYTNRLSVQNRSKIFETYCSCCSFPTDGRTKNPLIVSTRPKMGISVLKGMLPNPLIYDEGIIKALEVIGKSEFSIVQVKYKEEFIEFYEVVPKKIYSLSRVKGSDYPITFSRNWECAECHRRSVIGYVEDESIEFEYLSPMDFEEGFPPLIFIQRPYHIFPAIRDDVWHRSEIKSVFKKTPNTSIIMLKSEWIDDYTPPVTKKFDWIF